MNSLCSALERSWRERLSTRSAHVQSTILYDRGVSQHPSILNLWMVSMPNLGIGPANVMSSNV